MSSAYVSAAQPIKIGYLMDFRLPPEYPKELRDDLTLPFELVFKQGLEQRIIDGVVKEAGSRSIEMLEQERDAMLMELLATRLKDRSIVHTGAARPVG